MRPPGEHDMNRMNHPTWTGTAPTSITREGGVRSLVVGVIALTLAAFASGGCATARPGTTETSRSVDAAAPVEPLELLQEAADHEALYTLAGGLKPMSSGFWRGGIDVDDPDLREIERVERILGILRNDVWYADVQVFDKAREGRRSAHAYVVHRESLAQMIERLESFWSVHGITPATHPAEIVAIVDRLPREDRWRGYGHLFGYPDDAVDFFVEAGVAADDGREIGPGKDREFVQIPTHASDTGRFTYAVPLDHVPTATDRRLAEHAGLILAAYRERRPLMTDPQITAEELLELNSRFEHLAITEEGSPPG